MAKLKRSRWENRVILQGGLGNQLFQYAFAHFLAIQTNSKINLENRIIVYKTGHDSRFFLDYYEKQCTHLEFKKNIVINCNNTIGKFIYKIGMADYLEKFFLAFSNYKTILEKDFDYRKLPNNFNKGVKISFDGFWQNWYYVDYVKNQLIVELLKIVETVEFSRCFSLENEKKYLIIHVRRGDYNLPKNKRSFGVLDLSSYLPKITELRNRNPLLEILTVTDDPNLLENESLVLHFGRIIGPQCLDSWQVLKLMSKADYLMTANSSLSWWGGYLCMHNGGYEFIPKPWFKVNSNDLTDAVSHPKFSTYPSIFDEN